VTIQPSIAYEGSRTPSPRIPRCVTFWRKFRETTSLAVARSRCSNACDIISRYNETTNYVPTCRECRNAVRKRKKENKNTLKLDLSSAGFLCVPLRTSCNVRFVPYDFRFLAFRELTESEQIFFHTSTISSPGRFTIDY